jgi:hypothetical protein
MTTRAKPGLGLGREGVLDGSQEAFLGNLSTAFLVMGNL